MPGTLQLVSVSKTPVKIQTLLVKNDSVMLVNPDVVNNIFIGNDPGSQIIPVPALGSVTLDTKDHDLWVSTNGGNYTVNAFLMPNGSNWVPSPAQVAAQINALGLAKDTTVATGNTLTGNTNTILGSPAQDATVSGVNTTLVFGTNPKLDTTITNTGNTNTSVTNLTTGGNPGGIPVLRGTDNLGVASAQSLTANATTTLIASANLTKPSFEAVVQLNGPAGSGTIPFAVLNILWQDSNTGLQVGQKSYVLPAGNGPANVITYYISGPCRGNQVVLKVSNRDPAITMTMTWAFNQTSHVYTVDRLLQAAYPSNPPIGQSQGAGNPSKGLLFASSPTVGAGAGTTVTRMTAASNAKCKFCLDLGGAPNALNVTITTPSSTPLYDEVAAGEVLYRMNGTTGAGTIQEIQMPNGPLNINMINQGAAAVNPNVTIAVMEY
jgi:hypothetical protein